jgi:hypothetical protein
MYVCMITIKESVSVCDSEESYCAKKGKVDVRCSWIRAVPVPYR